MDSQKPPFPWTFLSGPDGPDAELAAIWFPPPSGEARKGFLEADPGILVGPFFCDEGDVPITTGEAIRRRANDETIGTSVMHLPSCHINFPKWGPVSKNESGREINHLSSLAFSIP